MKRSFGDVLLEEDELGKFQDFCYDAAEITLNHKKHSFSRKHHSLGKSTADRESGNGEIAKETITSTEIKWSWYRKQEFVWIAEKKMNLLPEF